MSRLTLRLPETLHQQLETLARQENVSLNQYIVYSLTRQATWASTLRALPETAVAQQPADFSVLLQGLGQVPSEEVKKILADREEVQPEPDLNPDAVRRLQSCLADS